MLIPIPIWSRMPVLRLQISDLFGPLQAPATQADEHARFAMVGWQLLLLPFRLLFGLSLAVAVGNLIYGAASGQWGGFWATPGFVICMGLLMLFLSGFDQHRAHLMLHRGMHALRQAAALGDDTVAPVSAQRPAEVNPDALVVASETFGPLRRPDIGSAYMLMFSGAILILIGLLPGCLVVQFWQSMGPVVASIISLVCLLLLAGGALMLVSGLPRTRPTIVTADAIGLRWLAPASFGFGRREVHVGWNDIRSLLLLRGFVDYYSIDAGQASLAWLQPAYATSAQVASVQRLCGLVAQCAHVRLRDITKSAKALVKDPAEGAETLAQYALGLDATRATAGRSMPPSARRLLQRPMGGAVPPQVVALVTTAAVVELYGVGWVLQVLQHLL